MRRIWARLSERCIQAIGGPHERPAKSAAKPSAEKLSLTCYWLKTNILFEAAK
jgi:hypothetical protein